ncbi:MAG: glycogen synthase, partial [Candidatus Latescibacteria bacterium]|nr:glycogen synthase [Candidatus Latescibacterota bacterium]
MRITFLSPEVVPFAKTGGLADVAGALPKALAGLGLHVDVIMPKYGTIDTAKFGLTRVASPASFSVPVGSRTETASVWTAVLPGASVRVYFIEHAGYFDRAGLYVDPATGKDYPDNAARFIFFARAALGLIPALDLRPDVIHCNDYQTGLVPAYLKLRDQDDPALAHVATLYSIHNLSYQGLYPPETMPRIGLGDGLFYPMSPFEFWGRVNFMKAGLVYADVLNTVSERYAQEIQSTEEFGCGLEGVLRERSADLYGIVNGIDYDEWNPAHDPLIPSHYDLTDLSGKAKNKEAVLKEFGLPVSWGAVPLIGMVSRLAPQKGFDILAAGIDELMRLDLQLVILGTGMKEYHD